MTFIISTVVMHQVCHGMNIGQYKEVVGKHVPSRDENTKEKDAKINIERHIDVIDDVLADLFETGEDSTSQNGQETEEDPLKFFVSTKTKTLKTTVTSTRTLTSYHTCYKANKDLPYCNRRKREAKSENNSILNVRPNAKISLIKEGKEQSNCTKSCETQLTWQDIIFPTKVGRELKEFNKRCLAKKINMNNLRIMLPVSAQMKS